MADSPKAMETENDHASAGDKHKTESKNPNAKRAKTKRQTTLEESLPNADENAPEKDQVENDNSQELEADAAADGESAIRPGDETNVPSSILEKGIVYFFIRGRVNIDEPSDVNDIARTYILLRPIPKDAKLGKGSIGNGGNTRLLALPKKVLPMSGKDRFMTFVEKAGASYDEIKSQFLEGEEYKTKTVGTRHTPAATPVGEGVYAVTSTGRDSHLVYMLTLPEKLGEVQHELGLRERGSFTLSTKNPKYPGPAYARLPQGPDYPQKVQNRFRDLRWLPTEPEHLDYVNAQLLLIGESWGIENALEPEKEDEKKGKAEPIEVLEHLGEEDLARMRHLPGDQSASVFADLQAHADDYPKLQTTF